MSLPRYVEDSYVESEDDYFGPEITFEEERHIIVGDLNELIELMNEPRVDTKSIAKQLFDCSNEIAYRLLAKGIGQGHSGDDSIPVCFEERCIGLSRQLKEYSVEMLNSPNLAQAISYALQGLVFLIGSLSLCDCGECDDYSRAMERKVIEYSRQVPCHSYFMPNSLASLLRQIELNFKVQVWKPADCNCWCYRCSSRGSVI